MQIDPVVKELDQAIEACIRRSGSPDLVLFRKKFYEIVKKGKWKKIAERMREYTEEFEKHKKRVLPSNNNFQIFMQNLMKSKEALRAFKIHELLIMSVIQLEDPLRSIFQDALCINVQDLFGFNNIEEFLRDLRI